MIWLIIYLLTTQIIPITQKIHTSITSPKENNNDVQIPLQPDQFKNKFESSTIDKYFDDIPLNLISSSEPKKDLTKSGKAELNCFCGNKPFSHYFKFLEHYVRCAFSIISAIN